MANVRQYPIHTKYRKFAKVEVTNNVIINNTLPYEFGVSLRKIATDGTQETINIPYENGWIGKQIEATARKDYVNEIYFVNDGSKVKVNARDLGITDNKELFEFYDEQIRIISTQLIELSQSLANGGQNPVADVLIGLGGGVGAVFPVAGVVTLAIGSLLKLVTGDSQQTVRLKIEGVKFLEDLYTYYLPYYNDQKTVMIQEERAKIKNGSGGNNGGNNGGDDNNNLNDTGSNKTLYIIAILLFLFRKKLFK